MLDFGVSTVPFACVLKIPCVHGVHAVLDIPVGIDILFNREVEVFKFEQGVDMLVYELPVNPFDNEVFNEFITGYDRRKCNIAEKLGYKLVEIFFCGFLLGFSKFFERHFKANAKVKWDIHGCFSVVFVSCFSYQYR